MKYFLSFFLCFCFVELAFAQVPEPVSPKDAVSEQPDYISSFTWTKTGEDTYNAFDGSGKRLSEIKYLGNLRTDTLAALHLPSRTIMLLPDFDSASEGNTSDGYVLLRNVSKDFYLTNPKSYLTYVNDVSYSPKVSNIKGSYVAYIEELDKTYLEENIRAFSGWGAKDLIDMGYAPDNTFWYRDKEAAEYGIIIKGKTMDYTNVTAKKIGDNMLISDNDQPVYLLRDYYKTENLTFRAVSTDVAVYASERETGCVRGNCEDGFGKYQYSDGHYDGFWIAGKENGYGLYKWNNGDTYIGNWSYGEMSGYGVYTAANNDLHKGYWYDGKLNGIAVKRIGERWEQGVYSMGQLDVSYNFYGNDTESGCTIGDCQNKYGKFVFENGDTFVGFFKNGNLQVGTYSFASGAKYSGEFGPQGRFAGMGRFWFPNGDYYGGSWDQGKFHGRGYYSIKETGETQIGRFNNGVYADDR